MTHGFDLSSPLVCEGIVGDGCGGGRIFYVKDNLLNAYDPISGENIILYEKLSKVKKLSKTGCILSIECVDVKLKFDIASLKIHS